MHAFIVRNFVHDHDSAVAKVVRSKVIKLTLKFTVSTYGQDDFLNIFDRTITRIFKLSLHAQTDSIDGGNAHFLPQHYFFAKPILYAYIIAVKRSEWI